MVSTGRDFDSDACIIPPSLLRIFVLADGSVAYRVSFANRESVGVGEPAFIRCDNIVPGRNADGAVGKRLLLGNAEDGFVLNAVFCRCVDSLEYALIRAYEHELGS